MTFSSSFGRVFSPTFQPKSQAVGGGFLPTDIANCKLWVDFSDANTLFTDAGSTKVSNNGDLIYQANDKSGNNYHLTQSTSAKRPTYTTAQQNGLSTALVCGTNYKLLLAPDTLRNLLTTTVTIIAVFKGGGDIIGTKYYTANEFRYYWYTGYKFRFNWGTKVPLDTTGADTANYAVKCAVWNSAASALNLYTNSAADGSSSVTANYSLAGNSTNSLKIGSIDSNIASYLGEIIIYTAALSSGNLASLHTYLNDKWAIY